MYRDNLSSGNTTIGYLPPTPTFTTSHPSLKCYTESASPLRTLSETTSNLIHHKELLRDELSTGDTTGNPPKSQPSKGGTEKFFIHYLHYNRPTTPHLSLGATERQPHHCQHKQRTAPHTPHKSYAETTFHCLHHQISHHTPHKKVCINDLSTAKTIRDTPTPPPPRFLTPHKELNRNDLSLPTQPNTPLHNLPITRSYTETANPLPTLPENLNSHEVPHKATSPLPKQHRPHPTYHPSKGATQR